MVLILKVIQDYRLPWGLERKQNNMYQSVACLWKNFCSWEAAAQKNRVMAGLPWFFQDRRSLFRKILDHRTWKILEPRCLCCEYWSAACGFLSSLAEQPIWSCGDSWQKTKNSDRDWYQEYPFCQKEALSCQQSCRFSWGSSSNSSIKMPTSRSVTCFPDALADSTDDQKRSKDLRSLGDQ